MPEVFISYSRRDVAFVRRLNEALVTQNRDIWVDWEDIPLATDFLKEIYAGIEGSNAFVFIISPDSARSVVCRQEIDHAVAHNKRIIPVLHKELIEKEDQSHLHPLISSHNWIFFRETEDFQTAFKQLSDTIDTDLNHVRTHTRLIVRGREWEDRQRSNAYLLRGEDLRTAEKWLAESGGKNPRPTEFHGQYILASRKASAAFQRVILAGVSVALVISVILALIAVNQSNIATNEANMRATQESIAVSNYQLADSRRLAVQSLDNLENGRIDLAMLLALEGENISDTIESRSSILSALQRSPHLTKFLYGHTEEIRSLAYSPDGASYASGSEEGKILLWDAASNIVKTELAIPENVSVWSVAFSSNGEHLAAGLDNGSIMLWDVTSGEVIGEPLTGHTDAVWDVTFSPDGTRLASGGGDNDRTIRFWNVADQTAIGEPIEVGESGVWSIIFTSDGQTLISGDGDTLIRFWNVASHEAIGEPLTGHRNWVLSLALNPEGTILASGSSDRTIRLWDVQTRQPIDDPLDDHTDWVRSVDFSADGKWLASASTDDTVRLWDTTTWTSEALRGHQGNVWSAKFSPDSSKLISGGTDETVILWDVDSRLPLGSEFHAHEGFVYGIDFSNDGQLFATGSSDTTARLWSMPEMTPIGESITTNREITSVAFSPDRKILAIGNADSTITLWDIENNAPLGEPLVGPTNSVFSVAFSPDGSLLVSGDDSDPGKIILWDVASRAAVGEFTGHEDGVQSVAFSPDGQWIASGSRDRTVILWNVEMREMVTRLTGHTALVEAVKFSPNGELLASSSRDRTTILWNVADVLASDAPEGRSLLGHTNYVTDIDFSPDSQRLVSGSWDKTVILWDVNEGQPIGQSFQAEAEVWSVAFHPGGHQIIAGDKLGNVYEWNVNLETWKLRACDISNRNLSPEEWGQYLKGQDYRETCQNEVQ